MISEQPPKDLLQRRARLPDPSQPPLKLVVNLLLYAAHHYPLTKPLTARLIDHLAQHHLQLLADGLETLWQFLVREVVTGPSSSHLPPAEGPPSAKLDAELAPGSPDHDCLPELQAALSQLGLDKVVPSDRLKQVSWYSPSRWLSMASVQRCSLFWQMRREQLEVEGENWLQSSPLSGVLLVLSFALQRVLTDNKALHHPLPALRLMWARLGYLHNKQLSVPVGRLSEVVLSNYRSVLGSLPAGTALDQYVELLVEYALALLFYYKYSQSEALLRHCAQILRMKMEFTGKLGRRTKYQVFDTPLLVMDIVAHSPSPADPRPNPDDQDGPPHHDEPPLLDAHQLVRRERGREEAGCLAAAVFDEQSILLQTPKWVQEQQGRGLKEVGEEHLIVALATLYYEWKSSPHQDMLQQNISAAVATLLGYQCPTGQPFRFALLLLRSLNEMPRIKNVERALDQMQKLRESYRGPVRQARGLQATPYLSELQFVQVLADKYMELGLSLTAVALFEQAGLFEECIDALVAKNYREKALELAQQLLDNAATTPRLLCMLGDIHKQQEYYEQAWTLSKHTYARAQRSLGWLHFNNGRIEQAANSFELATQASYYHPGTWFTLGCCLMQLKRNDKALRAFSECISIDDTQGEAWGNMASCYMMAKRFNEAFSTLVQAVRYSQSNWKLWANLLSVSLSLKKFYKYLECLQRLAQLGHPELLTEEVLTKVVQMMKYQDEHITRKRALFAFKNRVDRTWATLADLNGQNPLLWRATTLYHIELLEYYDILDVHYHNLHIEGRIDPNDLVPDYETLQSTAQARVRRTAETRAAIVDCKQCELNMAMAIGWDQDKKAAQQVKRILGEYIEIYREYSSREDRQDFRLFVGGVAAKVSHCLQEPFAPGLDWLSP